MIEGLKNKILDLKDEIILVRRDFHMNPELGMEEVRTARVVAEKLESLGLEVTTQVGETGVVGMLEGSGPGKTLLLRADMDALPILEENNVPYRSKVDGIMHACGHDGHMACLLAVAKILSANRQAFAGRIKFVFQPGEEGFAGARKMIEDGVLENPAVDAAFGLHVTSELPCGIVGVRSGSMMACMDHFTYRIKGKGGHAAQPEEGIDAIQMSVQLISALHNIPCREVSQMKPLLVHVGTINGGEAFNVVAENVTISGTVRTYDEDFRKSLPERMNRIGHGITAAFGGEHELDYDFGYPPLVNDSIMTNLVLKESAIAVGKEKTQEIEPELGSEDMAFFLERVPGCFFYIGARNDQKGMNQPHHNSKFDFDEDSLLVGVEVMIRSALTYLL